MNNGQEGRPAGYRPGYAANQLENMLHELVTVTRSTNSNVHGAIKRCHELAASSADYLAQVIPPETELQKKITQATLVDPTLSGGQGMLSGHEVGNLLKMVAEMIKAKSILEIGTYTGYGSVTLAETSCCEKLVTLDNNEDCKVFVEKQLKNTVLEKKIRVIIGSAGNSLKQLLDEGEKFDLVFIDADKSSYIEYYKFILDQGLLNHGGVFLCDNILWSNDTFMDKASTQGQALNAFVKFVQNDERVEQMIFPFRDGVMLIRYK